MEGEVKTWKNISGKGKEIMLTKKAEVKIEFNDLSSEINKRKKGTSKWHHKRRK